MFQLIRELSKHDLVFRQSPAMLASFVLASLFYRFGSFALECLAFLATWFVVDLMIHVVGSKIPETPEDRDALISP